MRDVTRLTKSTHASSRSTIEEGFRIGVGRDCFGEPEPNQGFCLRNPCILIESACQLHGIKMTQHRSPQKGLTLAE